MDGVRDAVGGFLNSYADYVLILSLISTDITVFCRFLLDYYRLNSSHFICFVKYLSVFFGHNPSGFTLFRHLLLRGRIIASYDVCVLNLFYGVSQIGFKSLL
jgi:hypothetical protein